MISDLTRQLIAGIYRLAKGARMDRPSNTIPIENLSVDEHRGKPVALSDILIILEPASNGGPPDQVCDIIVSIYGEEMERFENRIPPFTIPPVE